MKIHPESTEAEAQLLKTCERLVAAWDNDKDGRLGVAIVNMARCSIESAKQSIAIRVAAALKP